MGKYLGMRKGGFPVELQGTLGKLVPGPSRRLAQSLMTAHLYLLVVSFL